MRRLAWLLAAVACGSPNATPDATPARDAAELVPGANVVTIYAYSPIDFIRYRNGTSGWGEPALVNDSEYKLYVDDAFEVVITCAEYFVGFRLADTQQFGRVVGDGDFSVSGCGGFSGGPAPATVKITGRMMQPGSVFMGGDYAGSVVAPWSYQLHVATGTSDLIAVDAADRIAIRRKQKVPASTTLATLDLDREGAALTRVPFALYPVLASERITSETYLRTEHARAFLDGTDKELLLAPSSLLQPGDVQTVDVSAMSDDTDRSIYSTFTGNAIFELMPRLEKSAFTYTVPDNRSLRVDWKTLPDADEVDLFIIDYLHSQRASATKGFLAATQHAYLTFATPPDFDHDWHVNLIDQYYRTLSVYQYSTTTRRASQRLDIVTNVLGN